MEHPNTKQHHHYILPTKTAVTVGVCLLILTGITVGMSHIHLGRMNMLAALFVACVKASLVCAFFMNLKHDRRENTVIFLTSFLFLAIFIVLTGTDLFFRGDVNTRRGQPLLAAMTGGPARFKQPWISTPELVAHGKELFGQQCVTCHGADGKGDGPAAAALNPKPRNFHGTDGWVNGWKPSGIFKTLKEGTSRGMASFASLPAEDRWALAHFVAAWNPQPQKDEPADLAKVGIDPTKEGGGASEEATISVEAAIEILSEKAPPSGG